MWSPGSDSGQPLALLALFLFSSPRSLSPRAEKRAPPRAIRKYGDRRDIPWKVASLLPGLRYALRKAGSCPWNDSVSASTRIQQHFQEYAKLGQDPEPEGDDHLSLPPAEEGSNPFQRFPEKSLCQLRHYLLNPKSYTLKLSAATGCLKGDGQSLLGAAAAPPPSPPAGPRRESPNSQGGAEPQEDSSDPRGKQGRRKSTRLLMSMKRGSAEAPAGDDGRSAKRKSSASPSSKRAGSTGNSKGSLLRLANLQLPHGRKRGAEVLAARIVRKSPEKPAEKGNVAPDVPDSPDAPGPAAKRAKAAESPHAPSPIPGPVPIPMEVPRAERAPTPVKNKVQEGPERDPSQARGDDGRAGSGESSVVSLGKSFPQKVDLPSDGSERTRG
ncbi:PREDICTED: mucin-1-like [Lepidothrix coronata]|uniref:Mucin-1-like n=1 Tax=Lepidothrix coronata TaxID=321398 RepID=A0A6J0J954_9PASS|nr:PREDICTED: mucin-1-like [Lepidothrix coronata]